MMGLTCEPPAPLPPEPGKPAFTEIKLKVVKDALGDYMEGVHLSWAPPETIPVPISFYTLVRKMPGDSVFDVFTRSSGIPPEISTLEDFLEPQVFPKSDINLSVIYYRIYAVDELGREGQLSDPCSLKLAPQPRNKDILSKDTCLHWESDIKGGVFSYAHIWNDNSGDTLTSSKELVFSATDNPARFSACFPPEFHPLAPGKWHYALFVEINETYSLKTGYFNVP
jgi:hypothetical protein